MLGKAGGGLPGLPGIGGGGGALPPGFPKFKK
jgi:signal recognition particle subunit SRP54